MPPFTTALHNAGSIDKVSKRLTSLVMRLQGATEFLKEMQIESVEVTHQADLITGLRKVENWGDAVLRCIHKHLEDQGAYQAPDPKVSTPKKKRG